MYNTGINNKITQLIQKGILRPIKKGLYFHKSLIQDNLLSKEILANTILGPSYISLEYALSFYNLIPEAVYEMTSVCTKRSKKFNTEVGVFNYKHIKKELFSICFKLTLYFFTNSLKTPKNSLSFFLP